MLRSASITILVLLVALPSPSSAKPLPLRAIGAAQAPAVADGVRYAAFQRADGSVQVYDTKTGPGLLTPAPSCTGDVPTAALAGIGAQRILWGCEQNTKDAYPLVQDVRSTTVQAVPGAGRGFDASSNPLEITFHGIGRNWIAARELTDGAQTGPLYVSREGAVRHSSGESRRWITDLDAPSLRTKLCGGMTRPMSRPEPLFPAALLPFDYEYPYGIAVGDSSGSPLRVQRCAHGSLSLSDCSPRCSDADLSSRTVAWVENDRVIVQVLPREARYRSAHLHDHPTRIAVLPHAVIVSVGDPSTGTWQVQLGHLP